MQLVQLPTDDAESLVAPVEDGRQELQLGLEPRHGHLPLISGGRGAEGEPGPEPPSRPRPPRGAGPGRALAAPPLPAAAARVGPRPENGEGRGAPRRRRAAVRRPGRRLLLYLTPPARGSGPGA